MDGNGRLLYWQGKVETVFAALTTGAGGLTNAEAEKRRAVYGTNDPAAVSHRSFLGRLAKRMTNPLVVILLVANGLSALNGDIASFIIVALIVALTTILDMVQEKRAMDAVESLHRSVAVKADVMRDGALAALPVDRLVPGDVVHLGAGDLIPADGRVLEAKDLFLNQALLTGESYPVERHVEPDGSAATSPDAATNAVCAGASVLSGTGTMLVCRTGATTALGEIAGSLSQAPPPTAFEIGVRQFGVMILKITVALVLFVLVVNISFHRPGLESLLFALALAVGLTPELLPMIVTVTMARGAVALAAKRVIVKRLPAIHDLGAINVLCTDKTGTLTEAVITLVKAVSPDGTESPAVLQLACLNSTFETGLKSPLDTAILEATKTIDVSTYTKLDEVPFDFERRRVSVLVEGEGHRRLIVKGAPEDILAHATHWQNAAQETAALTAAVRADLKTRFDDFGAEGFRVLGIAFREVGADHNTASLSDEDDLCFAGFAVFVDPPKLSAKAAIEGLKRVGVGLKILTGDNERVAAHVAEVIGLGPMEILTGDQITALSDEALVARAARTGLFCRVNPAQKRRIIMALKVGGHTVGFLGDGINDAAALRAADVGISVDTAADVAREAADLILLDHDLTVIEQGVREGRRTITNVSKYIRMASSSNFGNMVSMAGAALVLPFLPMLPIQVLLNNLLYDFSQTSTPFDTVDEEVTERPIPWDMGEIMRFMMVFGPISSLFDFLTFFALFHIFNGDEAQFQTGWFVESLVTQSLVIFAIRTRRSMFASRPHRVVIAFALGVAVIAIGLPYSPLAGWLGMEPMPLDFLAFLTAAVAAYLILVEGVKRLLHDWLLPRPAKTTGRYPLRGH